MVNAQAPELCKSEFESLLCHLLFVWLLEVGDINTA